MASSRHREYFKNTAILFIGKFATQFSSLLLLPLFTDHLAVADYGYVDLLQTYISLFVPVLMLRFDSAVFRFLIDERGNNDKKRTSTIITTSLFTITAISLLVALVGTILNLAVTIKYLWLIVINIICLLYSGVLLQIARGLGRTVQYSIASVITSFTTLLVNMILILNFDADASCILISSIVANIVCVIYLLFTGSIAHNISIKSYNKRALKEMLRYSLPMIPNSLSWWIISVSDRTVISIVLGAAMNGIYAVSCKFSNILNSVFAVFNMSWQESAALHINDPDKDDFFTDIINKLLVSFSSISILIISLIPLFFDMLIGADYAESYTYIPILLLGNIFNIAIQLFGGIYIAKKMTKQVMNTTIVSALINLIIDVALINFIGIYAACISTLVANLSLAIYRYIDVQKYVRIRIKPKTVFIVLGTFGLCTLAYYINVLPINLISIFVAVIFALFANRVFLIGILRTIFKKR